MKDQFYTMRTPEQREGLQNMIDWINTIRPTSEMRIIEIGSYVGESTLMFSKHFKEVISVDPYVNDYDLNDIAKSSIDSIIYRANANIVLHDLRNNWVDDAYLLMAKAYLFHKNFDTAGSILQFINYSFDEKENGADLPIGSNLRNTKGKFSIATAETNRIWENENVRNESMIWQARNYFETNQLNEGISLLELLKSDAYFPKRLLPFLHEQLAYGYYLSESYENAANNLIKALPNAPDAIAKARWYFLIAQLYDKVDQKGAAYPWYQKASQLAINPILGVYAKINMIQYEIEKGNANWKTLTEKLEKLTKRDRYLPYADIIYFEMAKFAIQNKDNQQASKWLIQSIQQNSNSTEQRQKAFEQLGNIQYQLSNYAIAKLAYDSLTVFLKSNPNYENIIARKKWMSSISTNDLSMQREDSIHYLSNQPEEIKKPLFDQWLQRIKKEERQLASIFTNEVKKEENYTNTNTISNNSFNNRGITDFYFQNKNLVSNGKQTFIQKWGERPNVDHWRRKTSGNISYSNNSLNLAVNAIVSNDSTSKEKTIPTEQYKLFNTLEEKELSLKKWNEAALTQFRLYPDMLPMTRQVQIACDTAKGVVARLAGVDIPAYEDNEVSFADLKQRIAKTMAFVNSFTAAQIDGTEDKAIVTKRGETETHYTGMQFLLGHALPNVYFHSSMVYAILRHNGVELGKRDYLGKV